MLKNIKKSVLLIPFLILSSFLSGCARDNNANNDVATNHRNETELTKVNNNNAKNSGPKITNVNTSDRELTFERNKKRNNSKTIGNGNQNNDDVGNNHSKMRVAEKAAKKVSAMSEVETANIIVTDNNAYVAARLDRSSQNKLTTNIENKISRTIKSVDDGIDNVFVSVNPDFYDRMNSYSRDLRDGQPISGLMTEFSDTIRGAFPDVR
ncbi:MAG: YhcN/YlaJ family sporulation lipoprotein [Bacillus sp. (in: Bacteria)]|nr:YhcN/YlaJ family sporulation lipoprotein [Bacillus sp. (in: firmicutes)]